MLNNDSISVPFDSKIDNNKKYDFIYFAQLFYSMNDNEIALLISSLHKNLSINGRILTIDTSLNYQENGEIFNEKLLGRFKRIIKPLYLFLLKKNKNQFWGWLRDNKELQNIFYETTTYFSPTTFKLIRQYKWSK